MASIHDATQDDLPGIGALINHVIINGVAVWDEAPKTPVEVAGWLAAKTEKSLPVLVMRDAGGLMGYASYSPFRPWSGYRHTVEHGVYVRSDLQRQGIGKVLMAALITRAREANVHVMVGGIESGNEASLRLHRSLGFVETGRMPEVGRKFDKWLTLVFMQKTL